MALHMRPWVNYSKKWFLPGQYSKHTDLNATSVSRPPSALDPHGIQLPGCDGSEEIEGLSVK